MATQIGRSFKEGKPLTSLDSPHQSPGQQTKGQTGNGIGHGRNWRKWFKSEIWRVGCASESFGKNG